MYVFSTYQTMLKAIILATLAMLSSFAMADGRWYMVTAQCKAPNESVVEFIAITEGDGTERSKDNARFGFSSAMEAGHTSKECIEPKIETRNSAAYFVGNSRAEAEGFLAKELARYSSGPAIVMDFDAIKKNQVVTEQRRIDGVKQALQMQEDAKKAAAEAGSAKGAAAKKKLEAYCKAEGTAKGDCSCPQPKGAKACTK